MKKKRENFEGTAMQEKIFDDIFTEAMERLEEFDLEDPQGIAVAHAVINNRYNFYMVTTQHPGLRKELEAQKAAMMDMLNAMLEDTRGDMGIAA